MSFRRVNMDPEDWRDFDNRFGRRSVYGSGFGMDYGSPGQLGGLGGGYVQPNMMYFGETFMNRLFQAMEDDPKLASRLNKAAKDGDMRKFKRDMKKCGI